MSKTLYSKYDKQQIPLLPTVAFEGRIHVVLSVGEAERAVKFLLSQPLLGIDTETRPSFARGRQNKVSLLQVSTETVCFLFRLQYTGFSPAIQQLLEDTTVPKIGLSLHDDINSLSQLGKFKPGAFIDLQNEVRHFGIEDLSLQKLYANFFGQRISKRMQLSNWDAQVLNDKQKLYAATDAWACVMLWNEMNRLRQNGDFETINTSITPDETDIP